MGRAFECRRRAKEARWDKMSKVFPKLAKSITLAVKRGGPDADMNPALRLAINTAKAQNLPKDKIEAAIKRASGHEALELAEVTYEGKGPHGTLFFIECATDNSNRSVSSLKTIFNKSGGQLVNNGQLGFMFLHKAVVEFSPEGRDLEAVELELIDHGLEELEMEEHVVRAVGDFSDFARLTAGVEALGIEPLKAGLEWVPRQPVELSEEQLEEVEELLGKIEDDEDVQAVFTNVA